MDSADPAATLEAINRGSQAQSAIPVLQGREEVNADGNLPTWDEITRHALRHLDAARSEMSEVRDWLNSDWRPVGTPLSDADAKARTEVLRIAGEVKGMIDQAKNALYGKEGGGAQGS